MVATRLENNFVVNVSDVHDPQHVKRKVVAGMGKECKINRPNTQFRRALTVTLFE